MKFCLPVVLLFLSTVTFAGSVLDARSFAGPLAPRPFVKGLDQTLSYKVECSNGCDLNTIEGKRKYRDALSGDLFEIKIRYEAAVEAKNEKAIKELEKTYLLASIRNLEYEVQFKQEILSDAFKEVSELKGKIEKCESVNAPKTVDDSSRSFFDVFKWDRKGPPAPVEDRVLQK